MREPIRDKARLEHMLDAIDDACEFLHNATVDDLTNNKMLRYAVTHSIQIIGEAAYMTTKEYKSLHPEVEWRMIEGMRHVLVHDYYRVEFTELWKVVKEDLPPLREQLLAYIAEFPEDDE